MKGSEIMLYLVSKPLYLTVVFQPSRDGVSKFFFVKRVGTTEHIQKGRIIMERKEITAYKLKIVLVKKSK